MTTLAEKAKVNLVDFDFGNTEHVVHQTDTGYYEMAFPDGSALRVRIQVL